MRIHRLTAYRVGLRLRRPVRHASAERHSSESIVVCCRLADRTKGWGEGVPREYVTGETPEGALDQLKQTPLAEQLSADCSNWLDVFELCDRLQFPVTGDDPRECAGSALRCAVELSILDAFARLFDDPLSDLVSHWPMDSALRANHTRVRYSGVITGDSRWRQAITAAGMRLYGFAHCKLKVAMKGADDAATVRRVRRWLGPAMDLRLDANEGWSAAELTHRVEPLLAHDLSCIEQPVPHAEIDVLPALRRQLGVTIALDESLVSRSDAERAIREGLCDVFNLRLSKCGGFLNCLRLMELAHQHGVAFQLGCHPGESGILSAAGRHWAVAVANIRYLEGSYDRHLLEENLTDEDPTFGYGGWAPSLSGPGLGVSVDVRAVEHVAFNQQTHYLD